MRISIHARFLLLILAAFAVPPLFGDSFAHSTSGGTTTSGSVSSSFLWDNCANSSNVCLSEFTGPTAGEIPFTILLSLPSSPGSTLTGASLDLSLPQNQGSATINSENSSNVSSTTFGCNYGNDGCYGYDYYNDAPNLALSGVNTAVLTSITSASASWSGDTNAASLDLTNLGFGADLLNGGSLTLTGYVEFQINYPTPVYALGAYTSTYFDGGYYYEAEYYEYPVYYEYSCGDFGQTCQGVNYYCCDEETYGYSFGGDYTANAYGTGYNSDTSFNLSYGDTTAESAGLTLDYTQNPSSTPEPGTVALFASGLAALVSKRRWGRGKIAA